MDLDWRIYKTQFQRMRYMLENEINSDVTFKVGEYQEPIKAHKFILSMQSPVFEKMFDGSFCESEKDPVVPDISPEAFRTLLRYCYYDCLDINSDVALCIFYTAKKYMLPQLERAARKTVIENLDKSEMLEICKYAADIGDDELYAGCRNYLVLNLDDVNVWDIYEYAADKGDDILHEISRNYLGRNIDASNVWMMCEYATCIGDGKLYGACRNYIVLTLNLSNIWEVCKYATDTGDDELHASCKNYLFRKLNASNVWEVNKYATDTGDNELHASCKKYLATNLDASSILHVCKYAADTGDDQLNESCINYLARKLDASNVWEIYKHSTILGDDELHTKCTRFLAKTLNLIWKVCKHSMDFGDEELQEHCHKYLAKNGFVVDIWKVCKYATDMDNKELCAHCSRYLEKNILHVPKLAFTVGDNNFQCCCEAYLKSHPGNVWGIYEYAINIRDREEQKNCRQYFEGDIKAVREAMQGSAFLTIPYEVLLDFLYINDKAFHVDEYTGLLQGTHTDINEYQNCIGISISEIELFKACNTWAEAECLRQKIVPTGANKRAVLGMCLFLIRFPSMFHKDLLTVVYPTGILTQVEVAHLDNIHAGFPVNGRPDVKLPKLTNKKQFKLQQQASPCQLDFHSRGRHFLVKPSGQYTPGAVGTVFIESEVRVKLCRVWISCPGRYRVTVRDDTSQRSWSVVLNTKHHNHLSAQNSLKQDDILPYLDITPQVVLALGTKYSVTAERAECTDFLYRQSGEKYTRIRFDELKIGFREITVTRDASTKSNIYALTLCLV